jgi:EAL and modified HD-GYP domain-containing signal transduction protein
MVGVVELRKVVMLAGATGVSGSARVLPELMLRAFQHARFCELLAASAGQFGSEQFLIGLLSQFDAIMQVPMEQIVKLIPLSGPTAAACAGKRTRQVWPCVCFNDSRRATGQPAPRSAAI